MLEIKKVYGFTLYYDERRRFFVLLEDDGTEVGHAQTQDEAEDKAKVLSKQEFKRIPIFKVNDLEGRITTGELTSLNPDDVSAWVSMEKDKDTWGSGRQKINLRYDGGFYEQTPRNNLILDAIRKQAEILKTAQDEIKALVAQLEKPINKSYFNLA